MLKQSITKIVRAKLGKAYVVQWNESGAQPNAVFSTPPPPPPSTALWTDWLGLVLSANDSAPVLGVSQNNVPVFADLEADSPHILVSAATGGGKSVLTKMILSQGINRGAGAVILDFKRTSHSWAFNIPGTLYAKDIKDIHDALVAIGEEANRRNMAADDPLCIVGPRLYLVCEEMNATIFKLSQYWEEVKPRGGPKISPAIAGLRDVLFMGRHVNINVIAVAQMLTARAIGGPEARENFAIRCLSRYTLNAWKMLCPEISPMPKKSRTQGRWQIVKNGEAFDTQVIFATDAQARAHALEGAMHENLTIVSQEPLQIVNMTLSDAYRHFDGIAPTLDALRKAAQRDGFPAVAERTTRGNMYDYAALTEYFSARA
jgi:hypothetical protein